MQIPKDAVVSMIQQRLGSDQAQQAAQQLPDQVDHEQHAGLLSQFGVDPQELLGQSGAGGSQGPGQGQQYGGGGGYQEQGEGQQYGEGGGSQDPGQGQQYGGGGGGYQEQGQGQQYGESGGYQEGGQGEQPGGGYQEQGEQSY
ncbi:MAG: hypothetical protein JO262_02305 [Solirubrobacterales bacterium]|nr:hypothetical protein [Solirubrobacterales bacterium]